MAPSLGTNAVVVTRIHCIKKIKKMGYFQGKSHTNESKNNSVFWMSISIKGEMKAKITACFGCPLAFRVR